MTPACTHSTAVIIIEGVRIYMSSTYERSGILRYSKKCLVVNKHITGKLKYSVYRLDSMDETVQSTFTVEDVVNNDVWLKDLKRGLIVAVEATGADYEKDVQKKIKDLSRGDTINAELRSLNHKNTAWAFKNVEVNPKSDHKKLRP